MTSRMNPPIATSSCDERLMTHDAHADLTGYEFEPLVRNLRNSAIILHLRNVVN